MYSKVLSGVALGIDGMLISVETDISAGLPGLSLVGYLASSVKEAGERVRAAMKNIGYFLPSMKITVNLSPADVRKDGTNYDLAIAIIGDVFSRLSVITGISWMSHQQWVIIHEFTSIGSVTYTIFPPKF